MVRRGTNVRTVLDAAALGTALHPQCCCKVRRSVCTDEQDDLTVMGADPAHNRNRLRGVLWRAEVAGGEALDAVLGR